MIQGWLDRLNPPQRLAVEHTDGPLMVLAGAGSGKTRMLTSRIAHLVLSKGIPAYQVMAVTFTNKAAGEMRERVMEMLEGSLSAPEVGTFHSVCLKILRREIHRTPFQKPFVIYDDSDQLSLLKTVVGRLGLDDKKFSPKSFQYAINRAKCDALEPGDMDPKPHDIFGRHLQEVYGEYQRDLFASNAIDFGEIICMTYRILRDDEQVRSYYQQRFKYIHVDEYQDTNRAQYLLLSMMAGALTGGHQNLCVVGDEDQSIYKWRGADIRNIMDFESDFPGTEVIKLEQNYRSSANIVTAASHVIRNNRQRRDKVLWTENETGPKVNRVQLADERMEADWLVREVKRIAADEGKSFGDFAVFYRTHAQSRQFEDVLRREKIPYQIVGGLRFYDRKEIKDILAYLRVLMNPSDSVSVKRVLNVPGRGIGKTTMDKLEVLADQSRMQGEDGSFWMALVRAAADPSLISPAVSKKIRGFVDLMERLMAERTEKKPSELYHRILDETGYVLDLKQEGTDEAESRIENLEEFDTLLQEFEESNAETPVTDLLPLFLEQSATVNESDEIESPAGTVKMMTLHSSKGLEYPIVFLPGMEEGLFPSLRGGWEEESEDDIEEERRLCYVGMTRARERLYMSHVQIRRLWGNVLYQEPARFFNEIPEEYLEFHDMTRRFMGGMGAGLGARPRVDYGSSDWGSSSSSVDSSGPGLKTAAVVGQRLLHPDYGQGTIILSEGQGDESRVVVRFSGQETRKFIYRYVKNYVQ